MKRYNVFSELTDYLVIEMDKKNVRVTDTHILWVVKSLKFTQVNEFELSGKIYDVEKIIDECFSNAT